MKHDLLDPSNINHDLQDISNGQMMIYESYPLV